VFTCQLLIANFVLGLLCGPDNGGGTASSYMLRLETSPISLLCDPELGGSTEP
jgi:hypothetical protein